MIYNGITQTIPLIFKIHTEEDHIFPKHMKTIQLTRVAIILIFLVEAKEMVHLGHEKRRKKWPVQLPLCIESLGTIGINPGNLLRREQGTVLI